MTTSTTYHGRFAPTPSGPLHAGSLVAALGSFLDARAHSGRWSLRIDDTDQARSRRDAIEAILEQLQAHGLAVDGEVIFQSERTARYEAALARLESAGRVYRCNCTRARLRDWAEQNGQTIGAIGPLYPGFCREQPAAAHERHAWRFRVGEHRRTVADRRLGEITQRLATEVGDPVLRRADGPIAYHLANVVDDDEMGITQVVRGEDLANLTPLHVELAEALELRVPGYLHLPLVNGPDGRKLSKTNHAAPLDNQRAVENLRQAAGVLGLDTAMTDRETVAGLLERWISEWRDRAPADRQPATTQSAG
ncbi:tRNA glutamyl-Q(34) synthetase GluQRS [Guyparkeria sp. SCN-R1]|uniref:tRNA glutamyl-Q(34) synthetase GluQRS n=1 Tax=Guyparkeria sp. SCN-R1 TaxID=2341113 RepID=UPI000F64EC8A|nr:tRNA glutamyl-Q(34) synthetase GluQRS [Guyparkeria sp. SCN-R1]RRQ23720.1 tRNA glutamyl-Q(34) synthetase GluQRS [Guyparkeria sp. SCN-R1]